MSDFDSALYHRRKQQLEIAIINTVTAGPTVAFELLGMVFLCVVIVGLFGIKCHTPPDVLKRFMGFVAVATAVLFLITERYHRMRHRTELSVALAQLEETFLTTGKVVTHEHL